MTFALKVVRRQGDKTCVFGKRCGTGWGGQDRLCLGQSPGRMEGTVRLMWSEQEFCPGRSEKPNRTTEIPTWKILAPREPTGLQILLPEKLIQVSFCWVCLESRDGLQQGTPGLPAARCGGCSLAPGQDPPFLCQPTTEPVRKESVSTKRKTWSFKTGTLPRGEKKEWLRV